MLPSRLFKRLPTNRLRPSTACACIATIQSSTTQPVAMSRVRSTMPCNRIVPSRHDACAWMTVKMREPHQVATQLQSCGPGLKGLAAAILLFRILEALYLLVVAQGGRMRRNPRHPIHTPGGRNVALRHSFASKCSLHLCFHLISATSLTNEPHRL